jgi:hypothetical protein
MYVPDLQLTCQILARLEAFDARFSDLEKQGLAHASPGDDHDERYAGTPTPDIIGQLIDNLMYHDILPTGFPPDMGDLIHPFQILQQAEIHPIYTPSQSNTRQPTPVGAIPPPAQTRNAGSRGSQLPPRDSMTWGSEVELPQPNETFSPPRQPPTIHVHAPTESNVGKSSYRVASGGTQTVSHATPRTPPGMPKGDDIVFEAPGGVIHPRPQDPYHQQQQQQQYQSHPMERDLPPAPSESIKSNRPTPTARGVPLPDSAATQYSTPGNNTARMISPPTVDHNGNVNGHSTSHGDMRNTQASTDYKTAPAAPSQYIPTQHQYQFAPVPTHQQQSPQPQRQQQQEHQRQRDQPRDIIHVTDTNAEDTLPDSWDLVTQKLYGWAMVWDDETFVRAMERISLGEQVEDCPLTIFMMMTFKR